MSLICCVGGCGFIGSNLVDRLISLGHDVVVLDDLSSGNSNNIKYCKELIVRDIRNDLTDIFDKYHFDYVFHLAAQINLRHSITYPQFDANINIVGSLNILEQCVRTKVKKIIFSSTGGAIYSPQCSLPFTEYSDAIPESPYGISKLAVENYLNFFYKTYGLSSTVLRYSNVYGPRQNARGEAGVIAIFVEKAIINKDLVIFGDGKQTRDFIYVDDVVQANILALNDNLNGTFNVSNNIKTSVNDIAQKILLLTNSNSKIQYVDPIVGELKDSCLSCDRIVARGWNINWNLEAGLKETIKFFTA